MAKTVPTGYRDFVNSVNDGLSSATVTTPEVLVAKSSDGGVYYGRWRHIEITNAIDLASDTFKILDHCTFEEKYLDLTPFGATYPDDKLVTAQFTEIKIPLGSTLKILAYKS